MTQASSADAGPGIVPEKKQPLGADLIIPVGTILFAIYYLSTVWDLPWQAKAAGLGIAGAMAIVLTLLGVRFFRAWSEGLGDLALGSLVSPPRILGQRLGLLVAALAFILAMPFVGFTIGLFLFLMAGMIILSGLAELKTAAIIALLVSIGGYLLFIVFVQARFPHGPVENLLSSYF